mgnify:CR=1 FL=1
MCFHYVSNVVFCTALFISYWTPSFWWILCLNKHYGDTRLSELYSNFSSQNFHFHTPIELNGTENTIFNAFLYSLMSYLNIKTVNALQNLIVKQWKLTNHFSPSIWKCLIMQLSFVNLELGSCKLHIKKISNNLWVHL